TVEDALRQPESRPRRATVAAGGCGSGEGCGTGVKRERRRGGGLVVRGGRAHDNSRAPLLTPAPRYGIIGIAFRSVLGDRRPTTVSGTSDPQPSSKSGRDL